MSLKRFFRVGLLSILAAVLFSGWSVAAAESAVVKVNTKARFSPSGVATVSGTFNCPSVGTFTMNGNLQQPVRRRFSIYGTFSKTINCVSTSPVKWSIQIIPTAGRFAQGPAAFWGTYNGYYTIRLPDYTPYPPAPNCYYSYWDYNTNSYVYQCYLSGSFGPKDLTLQR